MSEQLDMFQYWSEVGGAEEHDSNPPENYSDPSEHDSDPRDKTPLQMVKEYQEVTEQNAGPNLYSRLIDEEYEEWCIEEAMRGAEYSSFYESKHSCEKELKELADLVYVIYGYANARGWDLDMALLRVHENNMGRMYQPDGTIRRRDDGKIVKNKDYPQVELSDLV